MRALVCEGRGFVSRNCLRAFVENKSECHGREGTGLSAARGGGGDHGLQSAVQALLQLVETGGGGSSREGVVREGVPAVGMADKPHDGGAGGVLRRRADAVRAVRGAGVARQGERAAGDGHHERQRAGEGVRGVGADGGGPAGVLCAVRAGGDARRHHGRGGVVGADDAGAAAGVGAGRRGGARDGGDGVERRRGGSVWRCCAGWGCGG